MTKAEAESVIKKLGFNVIFEEVDGDKDKVISQSPEQGSKVPKRSNITLNIGMVKKKLKCLILLMLELIQQFLNLMI